MSELTQLSPIVSKKMAGDARRPSAEEHR